MSKYKTIFNEFFGLEEIHKYNTIIKNLEGQTLNEDKTEEILQLLRADVYIDGELKDFVEGSDKYNELKAKLDNNAEIKKTLNSYSYKNETIISDYSISRIYKIITLFKHSITYDTVKRISGWEYDEETGEEYEVYVDEDVTVTEFFYTTDYTKDLVEDLSDMLMPYDTPNSKYKNDGNHIQRHLDSYAYLQNVLYIRRRCDDLEFSFKVFSRVFDIDKVEFEGFDGDIYGFVQDGISYTMNEVKQMMIDAEIAINFKVKGFVCDDTYVHYPRNISYVKFLTHHLNVTHFPVKV